jgi:protein-S-isoprenylcysteine O-methyltransferase Ste14
LPTWENYFAGHPAAPAGHLAVRNPIYVAALLIVLGEAWLFMSPWLLAYAGTMAVFFHLFVIGYEERTLRRRFGCTYLEYRHKVPRWIPRPSRCG